MAKATFGAEIQVHSLSYPHQKEYVDWISEAKRPETRERRIARTVEMLLDGTDGI